MKRPLHWDTPAQVRKNLGKIANELHNGELTPAQGNAIICAGNAILHALRTDEQKKRIDALEQKISELESDSRG